DNGGIEPPSFRRNTMQLKEELVERRWQKRYLAKGHTFAVVSTTDSLELCHLIDISMNGLSFRYFADSPELTSELNEVSILFGNDFFLENIPSKTVSDAQIESQLPSIIKMKRRGIKFGKLNDEQRSMLEYFIKHNTIGQA
ncbi:hypothetical protein ACFL6N_03225, partial [Thermodesulfobacteriota bacterium]